MTQRATSGSDDTLDAPFGNDALLASAVVFAQCDAARWPFLLGQAAVAWRGVKVVEMRPAAPQAAALLSAEG